MNLRLAPRRRAFPPLPLLALLVAAACGGNATGPSSPTATVSGNWNVSFLGTVQGRGTPQRDDYVLELQQDGSNVTGMLRYPFEEAFDMPVSGTVTGTAFKYTGRKTIDNCEVTVTAETTVDSTRLAGPSTQSTCEGSAVGSITAVRR